MKYTIGILVFLIMSGATVFIIKHPCLQSHQEYVTHPGWMQMIPNGKTVMPFWHAQYTSYDTICDLRK